MRLRRRKRSFIAVALIAAAIAAAGFVFTNSNDLTGGTNDAGYGTRAITGYTVTNVDYVPDGTNGNKIDTVTFDLDPATAQHVQIRLQSNGTWYSCDVTTPASPSCDLSAANPIETFANATQLEVAASQ
jgi:hypothetical protein